MVNSSKVYLAIKTLVPKRLRQTARGVLNWAIGPSVARRARWRLAFSRKGRRHGLDADLVVSFTSYPARFPTLPQTIGCLLDQTVRPDRLILWVAHDDFPRLPKRVARLEKRGLEIRTCEDLRSYKKLVPALDIFPDAFIATADDDLYYPPDWLGVLVAGADRSTIACHRAHRMVRNGEGKIAPYLEWQFDVQDDQARKPVTDLVPTGVGGILYPPRSLHPMVTERALFQALCPEGDDLWFYWCARMAGSLHRKVGGRTRLMHWEGSQDSRLWDTNECGGNDRMINALQAKFPLT